MSLSVSGYLTLAATILTLISCVWLFFRYIRQAQKTIGFSMIVILGISDFMMSILLFATEVTITSLDFFLYYIALYLTMYFSIFWASTMSIIVYRSLQEKDFESKDKLVKVILTVLVPSIGFGVM